MQDDATVIATEPKRAHWDRWTALMATLVAICALAVSWYTAILQRAQVQAQTWPWLQVWANTASQSFSLSNRGVGPAQVRDVKLWVDGVQQPSFDAAFEQLADRKLACSRQSWFARRVIAANEDVVLIEFCNAADFEVFANAGSRLAREICYCSVLDDCKLIDERATTEAEYHRAVPACPAGEPGQFR